MNIVTVEILIHDQEWNVWNWTQVHEFLELQSAEVWVYGFNKILNSHNAKENESWKEKFEYMIDRNELIIRSFHVRVCLCEVFPTQGFNEESEPEKSGLWSYIAVLCLKFIVLISKENRSPHNGLINGICSFELWINCLPIDKENINSTLLNNLHDYGQKSEC